MYNYNFFFDLLSLDALQLNSVQFPGKNWPRFRSLRHTQTHTRRLHPRAHRQLTNVLSVHFLSFFYSHARLRTIFILFLCIFVTFAVAVVAFVGVDSAFPLTYTNSGDVHLETVFAM